MLREHFAFSFKLYNGLMFLRVSGLFRNRKTLQKRRMRLFYQHHNSKMIKRALFTKICGIELTLPCKMRCVKVRIFGSDENEVNHNFSLIDFFLLFGV